MEIDETISAAFAFVKPIHDDMARTELQRLSWQDGKRHLNNAHRRVKMEIEELIADLRFWSVNAARNKNPEPIATLERAADILKRVVRLQQDWGKLTGAPFRARYYADELRATWESADG